MENKFNEELPDLSGVFDVDENAIPNEIIEKPSGGKHKITNPVLTAKPKNGRHERGVKKKEKAQRKKSIKRRVVMGGIMLAVLLIIFGVFRFFASDSHRPVVTVEKARLEDIARYYTGDAAVVTNGTKTCVLMIDNDYDVHFIEVGQTADIFAGDGRVALGRVAEIKEEKPDSPMLDRLAKLFGMDSVPETSSYGVYLVFDDGEKPLEDGSLVSIKIYTKVVRDAVIVPDGAVYETEGQSFVWLFDRKKGVLHRCDVTVGISSDGMTEITGGLQKGDDVLVSASCDSGELYDGIKVRYLK